MPPALLIKPDELDFDHPLYTREQIYRILPQRHEFAQLDGILRLDAQAGLIVGFRDVRADEWWCRGHMPGKPVFPGVLMVEACAQLAGFATQFVQPIEMIELFEREFKDTP